jgi:integrase
MKHNPYAVRFEDARKRWVLDLKASHFGDRKRLFFETELEAHAEGARLVDVLREKGREGVRREEGGMSVAVATRMFAADNATKSKSHFEKIEMLCRGLNSKWSGPVTAIEPVALTRWLTQTSLSPTTRAMWFRYARMFFRWAERMRFIERSPVAGMRSPRATPARNILTAGQMTQMLRAEMPDDIRALLLLGGFAGLRTIEVARMNWEDVDCTSKQIHVRSEVSKQTTGMLERIVDFTEPMVARKEFFTGKKGRIVPGSARAFYEERRRLAAKLGWDGFPENSLRHSFATYHLARCKSPNLTAFQMGHSNSAMVQRVYAVPAARADAQAWWGI